MLKGEGGVPEADWATPVIPISDGMAPRGGTGAGSSQVALAGSR